MNFCVKLPTRSCMCDGAWRPLHPPTQDRPPAVCGVPNCPDLPSQGRRGQAHRGCGETQPTVQTHLCLAPLTCMIEELCGRRQGEAASGS
jgi:hypothetical protein